MVYWLQLSRCKKFSFKDYTDQFFQVGVAPYLGAYGDFHTWIMIKTKKNTLVGNWSTFPVLKFFKGNFLIEFGYNDRRNGMPMLCIGFKEAFMKIFFIIVFLVSTFVNAQDNHDHHDHHSHEGHLHEQMVDGEKLEVDVERFDKFIEGLKDKQIAVVSVKGMVCDFCAQGIEKTFKKIKPWPRLMLI